MRRFQPSIDLLDRRDVPAAISLVGGVLNISAGEGTQYGIASVSKSYTNPGMVDVFAIDGHNIVQESFLESDIKSLNVVLDAAGQYSLNGFFANTDVSGTVDMENAEHNAFIDLGPGNYDLTMPSNTDNVVYIS